MADRSAIEWTDASWNPFVGCSVVSPGCTNCYAMKMAYRIKRMEQTRTITAGHYFGTTKVVNGKPVWTGVIGIAPDHILTAPLRWRKPRRIFVNSMSDLFHEDVPEAVIDRVFRVMSIASHHIYQILTKRAERMRRYLSDPTVHGRIRYDARPPWPLPNVWLGVSVEDQRRADERIPILLDTPAAVRWVSAEPLLGPVDLYGGDPDPRLGGVIAGEGLSLVQWWRHDDPRGAPPRPGLDWVVAGGESGHGARPMHPNWARSLRDQCAAADVPFLFKQWGEWGELKGPHGIPRGHSEPGGAYFGWDDGVVSERVGKKAAGRLLDGVLHEAWPERRP